MTTKNEVGVTVRFSKTDVANVEEGSISVRGEPGRWADAGWYAELLRVDGKIYLHNAVATAIRGWSPGRVSSEPGAIRWGRGRASAVYLPIGEDEILNLADVEKHYGGRSERERDRNAAIAAFAYALIDFLPKTAVAVDPSASVFVPARRAS